ncbi:MAG: hypothetical protein IKI15_05735 [Lachnospiraceae bacterium]|nr:hypothetical protein [Lachnospiraceae bacterium]
MGRKLIVIIVSAALVLAMTACGKGGDDRKEENKRFEPFGWQKYRKVTDVISGKVGERRLVGEYENLGTESTLITYEDGKTTGITKWYYDETGEKLLKKVVWSEGNATEASEWDTNGRLISYLRKIEDDNPSEDFLSIPMEYDTYESRDYLVEKIGGNVCTDSDVKELRTEYTYRGDTDEIATIKTVTDRGEVVAYLERGEGDIVLSESWVGSLQLRYDEVYDAVTRTGHGVELDGEGGVSANIDKTYDEYGRCTEVTRSVYGIGSSYSGVTTKREEKTSIVYSEDGSAQAYTFIYGYDDYYSKRILGHETHYSYYPDQKLKEQIEFVYPVSDTGESGEAYFSSSTKYTYHENGQLETVEKYASEGEGADTRAYPESLEKYDDEGNRVSIECWGADGYYTFTSTSEYTDDPAVYGKVLHTVMKLYYGAEEPGQTMESWELNYNIIREADNSMIYRFESSDPYSDVTAMAVYDVDGYLYRVRYAYEEIEEITEFDRKGRVVRDVLSQDSDKPSKTENVYEYWEGEKKQ